MHSVPETRLSPWISWFVILGLGPVIAWFLARLCGFEDSRHTLQIILLVEVCLVTAGVGVMVLVRVLGPWTYRDHNDQEWLKLLTPQPGSMLADLAANPEAWNTTLDSYLRSTWRSISAGVVPNVAVVDRPGQIVAAIRSAPPPTAKPTPQITVAPVPAPSNVRESVRRPPPGHSPPRHR